LRVACATPRERGLLSASPLLDPAGVAPISARNEAAALRAIAAGCATALGRFETTIEEDDALLRSPDLGQNARNCVVMRRGEKQVLESWQELARAALPLLRLPWAGLARAADGLPAGS